jgi:acetoacetyl-CoA synthetase
MTEVLTPIWRRVLRRPSIRADEDFFQAGGDPSLARELFSEIGRACGRDVSPLMLCQAPTIAALAAMLEQPTPFRLSPLVLLKAGSQAPPVFIAHGIGGNLLDFFRLARHVLTPHPIYGMQSKGMDGMNEPLQSIEDMAEFHLDAIREVQPHGPYLLIGYSLGGLVMLEMAQRLSASGEEIGLLAMLDSYPHVNRLAAVPRLRVMARRATLRASEIKQVPLREALSRIVQRRFRSSPDPRTNGGNRPPAGLSFAAAAEQVRENAKLALANYRPRCYSGKIEFVRAETRSYFPNDPVAIWAHLAAKFEVETVPGDHVKMIAVHFESLAAVLTRYVEEAISEDPLDEIA